MKMAPLLAAIDKQPSLSATLIHTGQHYDAALSDVFFDELGMRAPDVHLNVGSGSHGVQTAKVIEGMEAILQEGHAGKQFDRVVVVGDVNSTMAAALAATKLNIPVAHVEAGLRSFDRTMPEEINRLVTDAISDMLLVSEPAGVENLKREGQPEGRVHLVGNVMIDTLLRLLPKARSRPTLADLGLKPGEYGVVTLHRPSNVDDTAVLGPLLQVLADISKRLPLVFPIHPRTEKRIDDFGLRAVIADAKNLKLLPPAGYLDFLALTSQAKVVVTDSGGLQEESTVLGVPCLTMRANTERPITVDIGTSTLIGSDAAKLRKCLEQVLAGTYRKGRVPELWDGKAAERIAGVLAG
jgi:UDP-N-acetylglucosamine 2-epimerase (non-hydrolysing)